MERKSGILMPIFSLPSKYGIGDFGEQAYEFIDYLKTAGQKVWQVLPLVQTGYGNSPYQSVCGNSLNPYFISPKLLFSQKLITKKELDSTLYEGKYIDYGFLYNVRYSLLEKAFSRFDKENIDFIKFVKKGEYKDYALFMTAKEKFGFKDFVCWDDENIIKRDSKALKRLEKENKERVLYWQFIQYIALEQWVELKNYAKFNGIEILGDIPLYVASDSVDVWVNPNLFKLDKNYRPTKVAGVPPDYFCATGQLWGNPVYNYEEHKKDGFKWWVNRVKKALKLYDYLRIDHFRGLDRYFEIENGEPTAENGKWVDVPSREFFEVLHKNIDKTKMIAEDLGIIDDGVRKLLKEVGYPGMKILSFAFNGESDNLYLPKNIEENSVCFTGTHDNDTLIGLIENSSEWDYKNLINGVKESIGLAKINLKITDNKSLAKAIISLGYYSKSKLFIIPYADVIFKNTDYRINAPATVREQNWSIKFEKKDFNKSTLNYLLRLTKKFNR